MGDIFSQPRVLAVTAQIVSAQVRHNAVPADSVLALIVSIYNTVMLVGTMTVPSAQPQPAVPVKRSVFPDHLVCLEDGRCLVMLKRHLHTAYAMTPAQYRERWGLPRDCPMVALNCAARRSAIAKTSGLGRKPPGDNTLAA